MKKARISSRAAMVGWPASSIRWAVTTLCGHANARREEGRDIGVGRAVGEHAPDEAIAERRRIGGEALGSAEPVALEAIGEHGEVFPVEPVAHRFDVLGSDLDARGIIERQRGLGEHRRQHRGLQHHGQREVSGEAHADGADAGAAAFAGARGAPARAAIASPGLTGWPPRRGTRR